MAAVAGPAVDAVEPVRPEQRAVARQPPVDAVVVVVVVAARARAAAAAQAQAADVVAELRERVVVAVLEALARQTEVGQLDVSFLLNARARVTSVLMLPSYSRRL